MGVRAIARRSACTSNQVAKWRRLRSGRVRTQTHDYYRNGTVTLFAALDYLHGKVIVHTAQKHTHCPWLL